MTLQPDETPTVRLDQWLWAARFFRTRTLARQAVETGKVEVAGQRPKPARPVRVADRLDIQRGEDRYSVDVLAVSSERGPAVVAQALYAESEDSRLRRLEGQEKRAAMRDGYRAPEHRPDKRARRLIRALGDLDAT